MSKRRKNAGEGYGYMFHGSFAKKADAVAKERKTKGAWVKGVLTNQGQRYIVMSPRTNPIKRKKRAEDQGISPAIAQKGVDQAAQLLEAEMYSLNQNRLHGARASSIRKIEKRVKEAQKHLNWQRERLARVSRLNPTELLIMGANPNPPAPEAQEFVVPANSTIIIRTNPLRQNTDDHWMVLAAAQLYPGKTLRDLTSRELSRVAMLAAKLKRGTNPADRYTAAHARSSGATYQAPGLMRTKRQRRVAGMVRKARRHKLDWAESFGRDVRERQLNPEICGAQIGGEVCTRKPGHRGPHLPQGATLRPKTRLRHGWNPSAAALHEEFTGAPTEWETVYDEPHMPKANYAQLGKLLSLYVKPRSGGQVLEIKPKGTLVVADESARRIWFVGGDQDISSALEVFGALDRGMGLFELGEARRIDYKQRKEHVPEPEHDHWRHAFGEETEIRPAVLYDTNKKRLLLEGGDYRIEAAGIIN
jgi:hypothetical protein